MGGIVSIQSLFTQLSDLLFKESCLHCQSIVGVPICQDCLSSISLSPKITTENDLFCIRSYPYTGALKSGIHAIKFRSFEHVCAALAPIVEAAYIQLHAIDIDVWIPIPSHKKRYRKRGFNHVMRLIGDALLKNGAKVSQSVVRTQNTPSLFNLDQKERAAVMRDVFSIPNPDALIGKRVAIFDDIWSTGSTAKSVADVLIKSGIDVKLVWSLAFAE